MSDDSEICGVTTQEGTPCQHPAGENGFCWIPQHNPDDEGDPDASPGRPSKLTRDRQELIAAMIEDGHSIGAAARSNGITVQTFFNWMERGEQQPVGPYADFFDRITRARGVGESTYVDAIIEIAKENDDTDTLMSLLKSRYPEAWADVETGKGEGGGGVDVYLEAPETVDLDER